MLAGSDLIRVVETAYRLDGTRSEWLRRVAHQVSPLLGSEETVAYAFDLNRKKRPRVSDMLATHGSAELVRRASALHARMSFSHFAAVHGAPFSISTASNVFDLAEATPTSRELESLGRADFIGVKASDVTGRGIMVTGPLALRRKVTARERAAWDKIACHLAAGARLMRLTASAAHDEAVIAPSGRIVHAEGPAQDLDARTALRAAALAIDRARTRRVRREPEEALTLWRALVDGRWSLVDRFERDGRRYLIARKNRPKLRDPRALTPLERLVVAHVGRGESNKLVAYALGISEGAVAVRLASGLRKLGLANRAELVALSSRLGTWAS